MTAPNRVSPLMLFGVVATLPALVIGMAYLIWLGYRPDYLGHYAAGYGATLLGIVVGLAIIPRGWYRKVAVLWIVGGSMAAIALGGVAEATVYRIAKFDEIDFCNQSLGAVLAGLVTLDLFGASKPTDGTFRVGVVVSVGFTLTGYYFAMF